eukprot:TRINITY_DN3833_c0_g1_i7.p1 TRINITY_DN3833_c0_g1~~TRINITY_DN3833_c0_g1_i7.p1  ORF type:complete len:394 (-),score=98.94 TRINITY_DN3833_c0_g1_i7:622-1803(-)
MLSLVSGDYGSDSDNGSESRETAQQNKAETKATPNPTTNLTATATLPHKKESRQNEESDDDDDEYENQETQPNPSASLELMFASLPAPKSSKVRKSKKKDKSSKKAKAIKAAMEASIVNEKDDVVQSINAQSASNGAKALDPKSKLPASFFADSMRPTPINPEVSIDTTHTELQDSNESQALEHEQLSNTPLHADAPSYTATRPPAAFHPNAPAANSATIGAYTPYHANAPYDANQTHTANAAYNYTDPHAQSTINAPSYTSAAYQNYPYGYTAPQSYPPSYAQQTYYPPPREDLSKYIPEYERKYMGNAHVDVIDVNQKDISESIWVPTDPAKRKSLELASSSASKQLSRVAKSRNHIKSLAIMAKQKEYDIEERTANGYKTKSETRGKYGW